MALPCLKTHIFEAHRTFLHSPPKKSPFFAGIPSSFHTSASVFEYPPGLPFLALPGVAPSLSLRALRNRMSLPLMKFCPSVGWLVSCFRCEPMPMLLVSLRCCASCALWSFRDFYATLLVFSPVSGVLPRSSPLELYRHVLHLCYGNVFFFLKPSVGVILFWDVGSQVFQCNNIVYNLELVSR